MVRFALLGCAAAGLALSVPAQAKEVEGASAAVAAEARPTIAKPKPAIRKIGVLPPARPSDESDGISAIIEAAPDQAAALIIPGSEALVSAQFRPVAAAAPVAAPMKVAAVTTLPPLRPSFLPATVQPDAPPATDSPEVPAQQATTATSQAFAAPIPPSRPDFTETPAPELIVAAVLPPERPVFATEVEPVQTGALPDPVQPSQPQQPRSLFGALFGNLSPQPAPAAVEAPVVIRTGRDFLDERIAYHAKLNEVPPALVHRVVVRESKYNPRAVGRGGALGLMQIKHATARGLGYDGPAMGLLDAETNLTYAVKYLAGAYRLADGSFDRAVQHYARGYYYEAKRRNSRIALRSRNERLQKQANAAAAMEQSATTPSAPRSLFTDAR
jgi:soluble lytic murein transglycosylase-like protein